MMIATTRLPVCNTHFQLPVYVQRVTFDPYCSDNANSILAALGVPGRPPDEVLINDMEASFHSAIISKVLVIVVFLMHLVLIWWFKIHCFLFQMND